MKDRYNLYLSTQSQQAAQYYVQGIDIAIAANANAEFFLEKSIENDQEFALPYIALAMLNDMWGKTTEKQANLTKAIFWSKNATFREQQHINILNYILNSEKLLAYELLKSHLKLFPTDVFILSQITGAYSILAFSDNKYFELERLAILESIKSAFFQDWWFDCMYAYALTEVSRHDEARILAEKSLNQFYHNGHIAHTYSHILYETKKFEEGSQFLSKWFTGYDENSPISGHVRWHQALLEIHQNNPTKVLEIYHSKLKPSIATSPNYGKIIDAASLLWRLSLKNNKIKNQLWIEINSFFKLNYSAFGDPFLDLHKLIASHSQSDLIEHSNFEQSFLGYYQNKKSNLSELLLNIEKAISAHKNYNYALTKTIIAEIEAELPILGGSHAQRDLIIETILK